MFLLFGNWLLNIRIYCKGGHKVELLIRFVDLFSNLETVSWFAKSWTQNLWLALDVKEQCYSLLWAVSSGRNEIRLVGTTHNRCNCISKNIAITVRAICRRRTSLLSSLTPAGTGIYPLLHLPIFPAKYARSFRKLLRQSLHIYLGETTFSPEKSVNKLKSQASPQFLLASCKKCLVKRVAITMLSDLNSNNQALCSCLCTIVDLVNGRTCRTFSWRILAIFGFQRDVSALFERLKNGFFGPKHFVFIALQLNRRRGGGLSLRLALLHISR